LVWLGVCSPKGCRPLLHFLLCDRLRPCSLGHDVRGHALPHAWSRLIFGHPLELAPVQPPVKSHDSTMLQPHVLVQRLHRRLDHADARHPGQQPHCPRPLRSVLDVCGRVRHRHAQLWTAPSLPPHARRRCFLAIVWVNAAVPETKGRTLEEIEILMVKNYEESAGQNAVALLNSNDA
jgi:hypothetical protein